MALLELRDLRAKYGAIEALKGISLTVEAGEIVTLIGANGAGKTTTLTSISGLHKPSSGTVSFDGKDLTAVAPHDIVRLGLVHSPEGRRVFPRMTVAENLEMGAYTRTDKPGILADFERVYELFPVLRERKLQPAGTLSGGEQQMLAVGRAMMTRPKLLLLDEPSLGLAPLIVARIFQVIQTLNQQGVTILLVEQNARMALKIAHRAYVLETGEVTMAGAAADVLADPRVAAAYLGE
jgi:branched-chain amino acid transport system ATP-binding protein